MQKNRISMFKPKMFGSLRALVFSAIFATLSIIFGKFLAIPLGTVMRFSLENLPIMMSSMAFGPFCGMLTGIVADLIGCVLVGYEINPIVTLGGALIGLTSGLVYKYARGVKPFLKTILSVIVAHAVGSVVVKTIGLSAFYNIPFVLLMLYRFLNYLAVGALEIIVLYYLFKNSKIREILRISDEKRKEDKDGL
ncbi:MAG: folate family ECF transporter S component [Clostridia bacterium]|nr:folate family ECF transporter S component [Clostridia bacterium]